MDREGAGAARSPPGGAGLLLIAGVRHLQGAGPRALDARAAAGPSPKRTTNSTSTDAKDIDDAGAVGAHTCASLAADRVAPVDTPGARVRHLGTRRPPRRPFDRDRIAFPTGAPPGGGLGKVVGSARGGEPQRWCCPRCRRSVQHRDLRAGALREAWGRGGSGAVTPGRSWTRPTPGAPGPSRSTMLYLGMRRPSSSPRGGGTQTALSEGELWKVVGEYNRYMREGGEFDREVVGFDYWRRARGWR